MLKIVGGYDACLGGCVGVVKTSGGQSVAELLHIALEDGCRTCFYKVYFVRTLGKALATEGKKHADISWYKECGYPTMCFINGFEEGIVVFHTWKDGEACALHDNGIELRKAAYMV